MYNMLKSYMIALIRLRNNILLLKSIFRLFKRWAQKPFIKSIIQKCSVSVKDLKPFNNDCLKWKQFKQTINNKLYCNVNHYSNYNDKINYIDFYLSNKIDHVLNHKWDSNDHLNFKIYSDLLSYLNKYYQDYLQDETDIKELKTFCMKHNNQFPVFWIEFTTLTCKIKMLFNSIFKQLLNLLIY